MAVESSLVKRFIMCASPPSRSLPRLLTRTTANREGASYHRMGDKGIFDLLPRRRAPRILVVDDQPSIAGLMSQLLSMRGYDVTTAASAEQAERLFRDDFAKYGRLMKELNIHAY